MRHHPPQSSYSTINFGLKVANFYPFFYPFFLAELDGYLSWELEMDVIEIDIRKGVAPQMM
jgi:hypothetical protein